MQLFLAELSNESVYGVPWGRKDNCKQYFKQGLCKRSQCCSIFMTGCCLPQLNVMKLLYTQSSLAQISYQAQILIWICPFVKLYTNKGTSVLQRHILHLFFFVLSLHCSLLSNNLFLNRNHNYSHQTLSSMNIF